MDETPELPVTLPGVTYLREVAIEGQELYTELRYAGFTDKQALSIVSYMITDALDSRNEEEFEIEITLSEADDDDDYDEDNTYDDGDASI